jgi:hypothetical protein
MENILMPSENCACSCRADHQAILRQNYLFSKFSSAQIDRLCDGITTKSVKRSQYIFAEGDPGTSLFAIVSGTVKISVPAQWRRRYAGWVARGRTNLPSGGLPIAGR